MSKNQRVSNKTGLSCSRTHSKYIFSCFFLFLFRIIMYSHPSCNNLILMGIILCLLATIPLGMDIQWVSQNQKENNPLPLCHYTIGMDILWVSQNQKENKANYHLESIFNSQLESSYTLPGQAEQAYSVPARHATVPCNVLTDTATCCIFGLSFTTF